MARRSRTELGLPFTTLARMDFLTKSLFVAEFNLPFTNLAEMDFLALSMHTDAARQRLLVRVVVLHDGRGAVSLSRNGFLSALGRDQAKVLGTRDPIAHDIAGRADAAEGQANVYCWEPMGTDVHQGSEFTSCGGTFSRPGVRVPACTASTFLGRGQDGCPRGKQIFFFFCRHLEYARDGEGCGSALLK